MRQTSDGQQVNQAFAQIAALQSRGAMTFLQTHEP